MLECIFRIALAASIALGAAGCGKPTGKAASESHNTPSDSPSRTTSASEALERLVQGNQRFANGHANHPDAGSDWRRQLVASQHPFATVLACSDSRVPPEIAFDQGFGDIFVVRVAGEALDPCVEGSLEYGVYHLHTPLLLVLGHEDCGAIKAALAALDNPSPGSAERNASDPEPSEIEALVKIVESELTNLDAPTTQANRVHAAVETNVKRVTDDLRRLPALQSALAKGQLKIVGAIYDLGTGTMRLLP
jgi:carbonic anhydrase